MKRHFAAFVLLSAAIVLLPPVPALAQAASGGKNKGKAAAKAIPPIQSGKQIACPSQQDLVKIPELVSSGGRLRASIVVGSSLQRFTFRYPLVDANGNSTQPGAPAAVPPSTNGRFSACYEQWVRAFTSPDAVPPYPVPKSGVSYVDPTPGPTLRATVGDVIELGFLNKIDPGNFGNSIDRGDVGGCDEASLNGSQIYPKGGRISDKYPDCFHGSTTANIHFHGTHTNPNTTGDNVFVEIVSSKRLKDEPTPAETTFRNTLFDAFFNKCESELLKAPHVEFPRSWGDLPALWTADQKRLLKKYDALLAGTGGKPLWPVNEHQLQEGAWPQYYFGAYPYCFRLPVYTPPPSGATADAHSAHTAGAGNAEADIDQGAPSRALLMGQAPGTHWYHAHKHGSTTIDVTNGMTGAFVIEGQYDKDISKYYDPDYANDKSGVAWTRKQPVMVINQLGVTPNLMTGGPGTGQDKGPDFSVNGRLNPIVPMHPGEVQMWRIVNTSSRAGAFFLGPPAGFHWKQLAQDGVQFNNDNYTAKWNNDASFLLAAGNRADLLVQAPDACTAPCTFTVQVRNMVDPLDLIPNPNPPANPPYNIDLMTVKLSGAKVASKGFMPAAPTFPDYLASIQPSEVTGTKIIAFASTGPGGGAKHTINGHLFDGEVGTVVLLNTVEEWTITNATANPNISHPFHIHINPFQVVETFSPSVPLRDANGNPVYDKDGNLVNKYVTVNPPPVPGQCYLNPFDPASWKSCEPQTPIPDIWWDVFPIPSGLAAVDASGNPINDPVTGKQIIIPGHFKMRSRFVDYAGYYVIHCHILAHEDRGMMTIVEVAPIVGPYSHH